METVGIYLLLSSILLDILMYKKIQSNVSYLGYINTLITSFSASLIAMNHLTLFSGLLLAVSFFRIVNIGRAVKKRLSIAELKSKFKRSIIWLNTFTVLLLLGVNFDINSINLDALLFLSLISSLILFTTTIRSFYKWRVSNTEVVNSNLPTVTIGIPARNETQDLPACIESMLASDYPKLEIIVLDDCSHDKTPAIIKEYAHQGVRFIKGEQPNSDWMPKNLAMNKIFDEAKGEYIIFAGVDVRFSPDSVRQIVNRLQNGVEMLSVLPKRSPDHELSVFIQPLRYWWELAVPRLKGSRPPALSTCWAIKKSTLKKLGEFDSFRKSVQPEAHFAKRLQENYQFILSDKRMGIVSVKPARDQYDTAIRTRYPQAKRQIESICILLMLELVIFFVPLYGLIYGVLENQATTLALSISSMLLLIITNVIISTLTVTKTWILSFVTLPFLLIEEWFILIRSMLAYEFGSVIWKERNICLPMYKVEKELPKL